GIAGARGTGIQRRRKEAGRGNQDRRTRTQDRSTDYRDRFFKASLAACRGTAPAAGSAQRRAFYEQVQKEVNTGTRMSVLQMCEVAGFCRSGYYRFLDPVKPAPADMDLRDEIQKVALDWPAYGSRRITAELKARGWDVNRKRVQRIMREDHLLCARKRQFIVPTTDSAHGLRVYPNLAAKMILTGVDQLWGAGITYIGLEEEFVYLAVVLDAYSRRVIGWHLDQCLDSSLAARGNSECFRKPASAPKPHRAQRRYNAFVAQGWTPGYPRDR